MLLKVKYFTIFYVTIALCLLILQLSVHGSAIIVAPSIRQKQEIDYRVRIDEEFRINNLYSPYYHYYNKYRNCIEYNGGSACNKYKEEIEKRFNFGSQKTDSTNK